MKLSQVKVHTINAASAAALDTAVNDWLQATGEATYIALAYVEAGGNYSVCITYAL